MTDGSPKNPPPRAAPRARGADLPVPVAPPPASASPVVSPPTPPPALAPGGAVAWLNRSPRTVPPPAPPLNAGEPAPEEVMLGPGDVQSLVPDAPDSLAPPAPASVPPRHVSMLPPEILSQRPPPLPGQSAAEQAKHLRAGLTYLKVLVGSTYGDDPATPDVLAEIQALIDS